mgnify:CR=1 FL=1
MCALRLYTGNRLEDLVDLLAELLRDPLTDPLEPELIVVQSRGMERWLSLELARRQGVCANVSFPFPNRFADDLHRRFTGRSVSSTAFEPVRLRWRILGLLEALSGRSGFDRVRGYLQGDERGLRRFQLAGRLAHLFDQYLVFRPDMIRRWELSDEGGWQAEIWRSLVRRLSGETHRAERARSLLARMEDPPPGRLPERVSVFGIPALPRFHLDLLAAVARHTRVNLFLMNPCREYWGDIASDGVIERVTGTVAEDAEAYLHWQQGHPILASTGMMGRDFFDMIQEYPVEENDCFADPGEETLLRAVQSDVLNLRNRGASGQRTRLPPADDSIRVHSCHSPLREVEILHDRLLAWFERIPDLRPSEILVTTPDIETYAPFVRTVFDAPETDRKRIPYSIADRSLRTESELIRTFLALLDLGRERYSLSRVLGVLESPSVMNRFQLSETDFETIRTWAVETGIRWGLDEEDRAGRGLPAFRENTWAAGLQRLLMGYAMAGGEVRAFGGILPYDHVEGGDALVLEKLLEFASTLFELLPGLEQPAPPGVWFRNLNDLLDRMFEPTAEAHHEAISLRRALNDILHATGAGAEGEDPLLHLDVIRSLLEQRFEEEARGTGFMTGGVTFCAMLPMRSIPFRIICCLGMDGEAYPGNRRAPDFDLMAAHPRPGDRSRRKDDRYLFLETLISARSHLHLSYVGQSQQDNIPLPPSVLVSELLEVIEQGFESPGQEILEQIVVRHPLQAFSPDYFRGGDLISYSEERLRCARALVEAKRTPAPFFPQDLPDPGPEWLEVEIDDLVRFFRNPSAFLLRDRLGLRLEAAEDLPEDREPFAIEGLERYELGRRLLDRCTNGEDPWDLFQHAGSSGRIPHGPAGRVQFGELVRDVTGLVSGTARFLDGEPLEPLPLDLEIGPFRLTGSLEGIRAHGLCQRRFATIKVKDRLSAWIRHLVLNLAEGVPERSRRSVVIGLSRTRDPGPRWAVSGFVPVLEAEPLLLGLLERYRQGLLRPLPFFPESSWAYVQAVCGRTGSEQRALQAARRVYEGSERSHGDRDEPHVDLCFRNQDPLETSAFRDCASGVLDPLLEHEETPA